MFTSLFSKKSTRPSRRPRSFVPSLESLERRAVPTVSPFYNPDTDVLTINSDGAGDTVDITHDGAGNVVVNFTSVNGSGTFTPSGPVSSIVGDLGDGSDRVRFHQGVAGSGVTQTRNLTIDIDLGGGGDTFEADLHGQIGFVNAQGQRQNRSLIIDVNGSDSFGLDGSRDRITVNAGTVNGNTFDPTTGNIDGTTDDFDILTGSTLNLKFSGGGGNDDLKVRYEGELDGSLFLDLSGGDGNDLLEVLLDPDGASSVSDGSKGSVRRENNVFGQAQSARLNAGAGSDIVTFLIDRDGSGNTTSVSVESDAGEDFFGGDFDRGTFRGVRAVGDVVRAINFEFLSGNNLITS